jgi:hypothetical protein
MKEENIQNAAKTVAEGRTGLDAGKEIQNLNNTISPLEEARTLTENMKQMKSDMTALLAEIQRASGDMALSGRSFAGNAPKEKTADDLAQEEANKYLKMFGRRI